MKKIPPQNKSNNSQPYITNTGFNVTRENKPT